MALMMSCHNKTLKAIELAETLNPEIASICRAIWPILGA